MKRQPMFILNQCKRLTSPIQDLNDPNDKHCFNQASVPPLGTNSQTLMEPKSALVFNQAQIGPSTFNLQPSINDTNRPR